MRIILLLISNLKRFDAWLLIIRSTINKRFLYHPFSASVIESNMKNHSLEDCTCSILVNASLPDDPSNVSSEIWCQYYNECCHVHLDMLNYWLGGVVTVILCIIGITLNVGACCIWGSTKMRHPFNLLLIALSVFDCGYLLGSILDSIRISFGQVSIMPLKGNRNVMTNLIQ